MIDLAQSADPDGVLALLREYGAIAVLAAFAFFWMRGKLYNEGAVARLESSHVQAIDKLEKQYEERLSEQEAHYESRLIEIRKDRDEWKGFALEGVHLAERTVSVADDITERRLHRGEG